METKLKFIKSNKLKSHMFLENLHNKISLPKNNMTFSGTTIYLIGRLVASSNTN